MDDMLGKSIGDEWVYVQLPSNEKGWISADTFPPENAQIIIGEVVDESGQPYLETMTVILAQTLPHLFIWK